MLGEWGLFALLMAAMLAVFQIVLPWCRDRFYSLTLRLSLAQCVMMLVSIGCLGVAFLKNDWTLRYVATNANALMPWYYRLCAVWGAHEGSMLLWVTILTVWMAGMALFSKRMPLAMRAQCVSVLSVIAFGFYVFIVFTSNPFARLLELVPSHGMGLNPLLQDPGLVSHPPMLYTGYVGFCVSFAMAVVALINGRLDASWARWARPWTLAAWGFLTLGIVLGSWWAYRELGWGGWWFWDPVENASFLPWLAGTALLHSLIVTEKRQVSRAWTALLALSAFCLSLLGTFLVRSGVLISVHAFASDPKRGLVMLAFLGAVVSASLLLYAWRSHRLIAQDPLAIKSREMLLMANNVIVFVAMLTVLLGTLYPLVIDALGWEKISVGAPYFNTMTLPMFLPMLLLMGFAPYLRWRGTQLILSWKPLGVIAGLACMSVLVVLGLLNYHWSFLSAIGIVFSVWLLMTTAWSLQLKREQGVPPLVNRLPMVLAHLGVAVTALGVIVASTQSKESLLSMQVGDTGSLAGYTITLKGFHQHHTPNTQITQADVALSSEGRWIATLHPAQNYFPAAGMTIAKTDMAINAWRDVYVALGAQQPDGRWGVRFYVKPLVRWIWFGGLLMVLAALIGVWKKRRAS